MYTRLTNDTSEEGYMGLLEAAKGALAGLQLAVRRVKFSVDGEWYVGVVNQAADEIAKKHGSSFSIAELQYLRALLTTIALLPDAPDGEGFIRETEALNVRAVQSAPSSQPSASQAAAPVPALSLGQKETVLKKFKDEMWLVEPQDDEGLVGIGVRSFLELHELLLGLDLPDGTRAAWEKFL
ncbi:hypothetical protein WJX73_001660 [Symbiochloris irregularis]|uniref:Non-structural maintenance of chromosomes element 1 homolog n=1 Tax=Symbiochloris irregularis TaxID=706552 RepID=A0AAW1NJB1_9CHLO